MILLAMIFAIVMYCEIRYLKKKKEKLAPYVIIYIVLFLASELVYLFREHS